MIQANTITMAGSTMVMRTDRTLTLVPKMMLMAGILVFQMLLLYGDHLTGPWVPFSILYLFTLFFAVKYLGLRTAYAMALFIVATKTYIKVSNIGATMLWWQVMMQFVSSFSIYAFFCYLIKSQLGARKNAEIVAEVATERAGAAERKLVNISEEVQQRIGRELHDDLGQHLTGIAFKARILSNKLRDAGVQALEDADAITNMLNQAISKTRNIAHGLYPAELEEQGLCGMLEKFAEHIEIMYSVNCYFDHDPDYHVEDHEVAVHLFRIVQEAVSNAIKHGYASHIILRVSAKPEAQILEIIDNGQGMNVGALVSGVGLRSMRFRADLIGAKLDVLDRKGGGTRVVITCAISGEG